jgi:hypothetical protein
MLLSFGSWKEQRQNHAFATRYCQKSRGRAGLCATLSAADLLPGGRPEAGRCHDGLGTDRTVPKPGQEEIGVCARPGTFPERHGSSRERSSEPGQLSRFVPEMINALERSSYTLLMLCACVPG